MVNFVAFKSQHHLEHSKYHEAWVCPTDKTEFMGMFRDWEPEVQALLDVSRRSPAVLTGSLTLRTL